LGRTGEEIEIDAATNGPPGNAMWSQQDILTMGIAVIHSVREGGVVAFGRCLIDGHWRKLAICTLRKVPRLEIEGMGSIKITVGVISG
jgi:hypothetical protein